MEEAGLVRRRRDGHDRRRVVVELSGEGKQKYLALFDEAIVVDDGAEDLLLQAEHLVPEAAQLVQVNRPDLHSATLPEVRTMQTPGSTPYR